MSLFDAIQSNLHNAVNNTFGVTAAWNPSNGGDEKTAIVLFKDASETARMLGIEYDPQRPMIEYKIGDLTGLKESVNDKNDEILTINGIEYGVNDVKAKHDGKTFFADLQVI